MLCYWPFRSVLGVILGIAVVLAAGILAAVSREERRRYQREVIESGVTDFVALYDALPDELRAWVQREDCWVFDRAFLANTDFIGPFRMEEPDGKGFVEVYGKHPECEDSLHRFRQWLLERDQ